jgi:hypothetical protein
MPPERSRAAARRIDQDVIERATKRGEIGAGVRGDRQDIRGARTFHVFEEQP